MGDNRGKGKDFKKSQKQSFLQKQKEGGGGGLNSKVCFWKISVMLLTLIREKLKLE